MVCEFDHIDNKISIFNQINVKKLRQNRCEKRIKWKKVEIIHDQVSAQNFTHNQINCVSI